MLKNRINNHTTRLWVEIDYRRKNDIIGRVVFFKIKSKLIPLHSATCVFDICIIIVWNLQLDLLILAWSYQIFPFIAFA